MKRYQEPPVISQATATRAFANGKANEICDALVAVALNGEDWKWGQTQCLEFLAYPDSEVQGLAATCLGHIARIHRKLDRDLVVAELRKRLLDPRISGRVQDALDDIEQFMSPIK